MKFYRRSRFQKNSLLLITALLLFFCVSCAHLRERLFPTPPSVVLITLDSINVSHLGVYGYKKNTTPNLDSIANESVIFTRAYSTSAWTSPGLVSILTGLYPSVHGVTGRGKSIPVGLTTLPRALAAKGFHSPGISYLLSIPNYANLGFSPPPPGFVEAPDNEDDAVLHSRLAAHPPEPFFLWYHYAVSHLPYDPPEPWRNRFSEKDEEETQFIQNIKSLPVYRKSEHKIEVTPRERAVVENLYDAELAYQDHLLGRTVNYLKELGLLDKVILIITSDHGEELFEHGFVGHASTSLAGNLYGELTHIPMIVRFPGGQYRGRIDKPVSQVDIMPTILDFLGIETPYGLQGHSMMPIVRGEDVPPRPLFLETTRCGYQCAEGEIPGYQASVILGPWKIVSSGIEFQRERWELYNLEEDPGENHNLIDADIRQTEVMKQIFTRQFLLNKRLASDFRESTGTVARFEAEAVPPDQAPIIINPNDGAIINFSPDAAWLVLDWIGNEDDEYLIEYRAGAGERLLSGRFEVRGNRKKFGPIPRSTWDQLPAYNPFRFRVRQEPNGPWSPWRKFIISKSEPVITK